MSALGLFIRPEGDALSGDTTLEQKAAEIQLSLYPSASISSRTMDIGRPAGQIFERFKVVEDLTMHNGDLVFQARNEYEVRDLLNTGPADDISQFYEQDDSPFSVFNGLLKPANLFDARITYKFVGVLESGPVVMNPMVSTVQATVVKAGIINFVNVLKTPIRPGQLMTWIIDDSAYKVSDDYTMTREHMYLYAKRHRYQSPLVKGLFVPASVQSMREELTDAGMMYFQRALSPDVDWHGRPFGVPAAVAAAPTTSYPGAATSSRSILGAAVPTAAEVEAAAEPVEEEAVGERRNNFIKDAPKAKAVFASMIDAFLATEHTDTPSQVVRKMEESLSTSADAQVRAISGFWRNFFTTMALVSHLHSSNIVGVTVSNVGPNEIGQLLLYPK